MLVTGISAGLLFCFIDSCANVELEQKLVEAVVYPGTEYYHERGRLCEEVLVDL